MVCRVAHCLADNVHEVLRRGVELASDPVDLGPHRDRPLVAVWTHNGKSPPALLIMREHPSGSTRSMLLFENEVQDLVRWLCQDPAARPTRSSRAGASRLVRVFDRSGERPRVHLPRLSGPRPRAHGPGGFDLPIVNRSPERLILNRRHLPLPGPVGAGDGGAAGGTGAGICGWVPKGGLLGIT